MTAKIKGVTWKIKPPYLYKPIDDKNRKDIQLKIDDDLEKAYTYIARYLRMDAGEVKHTFEGNTWNTSASKAQHRDSG